MVTAGTVDMKGTFVNGKLNGGVITVTTEQVQIGAVAYLLFENVGKGSEARKLLGPLAEFGIKQPTFQVRTIRARCPLDSHHDGRSILVQNSKC